MHARRTLFTACGLIVFPGDATLMFYMMVEAQERLNAFREKRAPDLKMFPKFL